MNIAFVANGQKLQFFDLIGSKVLEFNDSISIFWICISREQYNYLLKRGYDSKTILLINWDIRNRIGESIGEYKINELVWGDRELKKYPDEGALYLKKLQSLFYNFVQCNSLRYIFGEMTWAHEILMNRICRDKFKDKCFFLHPQSIRIPNGRFTFMDTEFQDSIFPVAEFIQPEKILDNFTIPVKPAVPQRVADVAKDVQYSLTWKYKWNRVLGFLLVNRLKPIPKDSLQGLGGGLRFRIKTFFVIEYKKFFYTRMLKKSNIGVLSGRKFFFYTLHMQPEASVDVVGRYYEDQFELIKNVWRILPDDYFLVIKEHTNAIGNRGKHFFKRCLSLRNVLIIDENEKSHALINQAETVFTNSGTVALEGALYNKDVFVFSNIFYGKINTCHRIGLDDLKYSSNYFDLLTKCKIRDKDKMTIEEYSKYIIRSSFEGIIDPHLDSPYFSDERNIQVIAEGFNLFLSCNNPNEL